MSGVTFFGIFPPNKLFSLKSRDPTIVSMPHFLASTVACWTDLKTKSGILHKEHEKINRQSEQLAEWLHPSLSTIFCSNPTKHPPNTTHSLEWCGATMQSLLELNLLKCRHRCPQNGLWQVCGRFVACQTGQSRAPAPACGMQGNALTCNGSQWHY